MDIDWSPLTRIGAKASLYARETYFREGWCDAVECLGGALPDVIRHSALLMIKPDGLRAGVGPRVVDFVVGNGFEIADALAFTLHPMQWRELWRYQLTSATSDRLRVNDLVLCNPALLMVLRDVSGSALPATVRMSTLKGPSDVSRQPPGCLRRLLGQPNRVFSYFHVADEPADLLRESAIFLPVERRRAMWANLLSPASGGKVPAVVSECLGRAAREAAPLDLALSLRHVRDRVDEAAARSGASNARLLADGLRQTLATAGSGGRIAWRPFEGALRELGAEVEPWPLATIGANCIIYDEPGCEKVIGGVVAEDWASPVHAG
jgi:nucleoside diphosphate kinase